MILIKKNKTKIDLFIEVNWMKVGLKELLIWIISATGTQQVQIQQQHQQQQQQIIAQQSQSQLESQESLVQSQLADESDQVPHSSRKQKIKQVKHFSFLIKIHISFFRLAICDVKCHLIQTNWQKKQQQQQNRSNFFSLLQYVKREIAKFFGVDVASEERERVKWSERQKRLALRRFGSLKQVHIPSVFFIHFFVEFQYQFVEQSNQNEC